MRMETPLRKSQNGAVLVVALILLLVLTILGVSTMTTTSMEERMAANAQEMSRAMQAADSGINRAFRWVDTANITAPQVSGSPLLSYGATGSGQDAGAYYVARYLGATAPPISAGNNNQTFGVTSGLQAYYFDIQSTGGNRATQTAGLTSGLAASNTSTVIVNGGMYQMGSSGN